MSEQESYWHQLDWDEWRAHYSEMGFDEQARFYRKVAALYPLQRSFEPQLARQAFAAIGVPRGRAGVDVVELGGWDGMLAGLMIVNGTVASWINYDLVRVPQLCEHPAYEMVVLDDYLWNKGPVEADVFVACHTIEHITGAEFEKLLDVLRVAYLYLEIPLPPKGPVDWTGYPGSHIFEHGEAEVARILRERGYFWRGAGLWAHGQIVRERGLA